MFGVVRHFLSNLQSTLWITTTARYRKAGGTLFIEFMASASSSTTSCTMQQSFAELPSQVQLSASAGHVIYICMPQSSTYRRRHMITQTAVLHRVRWSLRHIQGCQSCKHTSSRPTREKNTHPPAPLVLPYRNAHAELAVVVLGHTWPAIGCQQPNGFEAGSPHTLIGGFECDKMLIIVI